MTESQQEYIDYLERVTRNTGKSLAEIHSEKIAQEVGKSYGLSLFQTAESVNIAERNC